MSGFVIINFSLIVWLLKNPKAEKAPFTIPGVIAKVPDNPIPTLVAVIPMLGFNLYNVVG